jgi:hypothetical protein
MNKCAVVVPIGPNCRPDFVRDTLDSVDFFCPDRRLVLVDDSKKGIGELVAKGHDATIIVVSDMGLAGGLFGSLSLGFQEALKSDFDVLVRLDTDALVTDGRFANEAASYFERNPKVGSLGSYKYGYSGTLRSAAQPRKRLLWEMSGGAFRNPRLAAHLVSLTLRALKNGYRPGESIMGGVALYSRGAIEALASAGALRDSLITESALQEDHLFALWLGSLGFGLADFGGDNDELPMGVKHKGLPAHPSRLLEKRKALVHSTRRFEDLDEGDLRRLFREDRERRSRGTSAIEVSKA